MRWVGAALTAATLAACANCNGEKVETPPSEAGPQQLAEAEPNDRPEQALAVTGDAVVAGSLSADPSHPDEDWYVLSAPTPRQVDLSLSAIAGTDGVISVFDQDRNPVLTVNGAGEGKGERFPNLSLSHKLFVRVSGAKKGAGGAYTLTFRFAEPQAGFEQEPNDRAADAHPLTLGESAQGFLAHPGDQDWYVVEIPAPSGSAGAAPVDGGGPHPPPGSVPSAAQSTERPSGSGTPSGARAQEVGSAATDPSAATDAAQPEAPSTALRIEVTPVPGARLDVSVLSAAEAPLLVVRGKDDEGLTLRNVGVRANDRTIFVVVKSAWMGSGKDAKRGFNADTPYTLAASLEPAGANAELEPNDDLARATPLLPNSYREGFISPKSDQDYFVLRTAQPSLVRFQLSGVERMDLALEVVRPKPGGGVETVLRANDGEIKEPEQLNDVACSGECYIKVEGGLRKIDGKLVRDFENAEQPYRLYASVSADTGAEEREPNSTPDSATPLALGQSIRGTIHPKKDVDFYRLDLSAQPVRTPIRATLLGVLKVDLGLYLHRLEGGSAALVQTSDRARGDQPEIIRYSAEPGVYLLEVRDSTRRSESNFQDRYQLTVQEGE
jgi:hypothetical protein